MNCKIIGLIKVEENNKIDEHDMLEIYETRDVAIKEELNCTDNNFQSWHDAKSFDVLSIDTRRVHLARATTIS